MSVAMVGRYLGINSDRFFGRRFSWIWNLSIAQLVRTRWRYISPSRIVRRKFGIKEVETKPAIAVSGPRIWKLNVLLQSLERGLMRNL